MLKKKVNTTPVDYAALNQLYKDFETRFVLQIELSAKQAFWSQNLVNSSEPILSRRPTVVEVPKELPKVSMVNTSLKKLKHHLASFDVVVKERTTPTAITEGLHVFSILPMPPPIIVQRVNHDNITVQPVQRRQISYVAGTIRTFTPRASGSNSGKQRIVTCYNCKGEGNSKECLKPWRKTGVIHGLNDK
ncbi:hypothetical protein Tco_0524995 [Tanacetum coccineum]